MQQHAYSWCKKTLKHLCTDGAISVCGNKEYPDKMGVVLEGEVKLAANTDKVTVSFETLLNKSICQDGGWALESV